MSLVVILYLALLSVFALGYLYQGAGLLKTEMDDAGKKRILFSLKAQENDDVDFIRFRKHSARLSIVMGLLYLSLIALSFALAPNLFRTLTTREIHLVRTCIIAALTLHFFRDIWKGAFRESFVKRAGNTHISAYDFKQVTVFTILTAALIYSIYTQITYTW